MVHSNVFFFNENVRISLKISLKFVSKGPINNILALVQIMGWRRPGNKPLSQPIMVRLQTHICITQPQLTDMYIYICTGWIRKSLNVSELENEYHTGDTAVLHWAINAMMQHYQHSGIISFIGIKNYAFARKNSHYLIDNGLGHIYHQAII